MNQNILYKEKYRPQFHFTSAKNWLNDPNGCVYYEGEYHLFFQHNPSGIEWENMTWGHAVSPDLVHWRQLPHVIAPYDGGYIFSGTAVADTENSSGLGQEKEGPLVAAFTHAKKPYGQAIAYSNDNGRNWKLYDGGRHILPNQGLHDEERDPKIFWHKPSRKWIMVLSIRKNQARFLTSDNLLQWHFASDFISKGFYECPDLIPLPVDGNTEHIKWVLYDAGLNYWTGSFDGRAFIPEEGPVQGEFGYNFYAGQTWNNTGSRIIQIGWMRGCKYPGMPFNQQMSFPCELSLRKTSNGIRLCRMPVKEIENLRMGSESLAGQMVRTGQKLCIEKSLSFFDMEIDAQLSTESSFAVHFYDHSLIYACERIHFFGESAPLTPENNRLILRILVDRTSVEIFGNNGEVCLSSCILPVKDETSVEFQAKTGQVLIKNFTVHRLRSAWD
ncbi:MAG: glycoside hydrolase family 32 protein [Calditrichaceae bacterium]|nr:glycoside hydrolase family 32 protein [Calditrichaceae bacterium]